MMVAIQQIPLSITDGNVNSGKLLTGLFRRSGFRGMLLDYLFQPAITREVVSSNLRSRAKAVANNPIDGFRGQILHDLYFNEFAYLGWSVLIRLFYFHCLRYYQNRGLLLATPSSFGRLPRTSFILRVHRGKESFVHFHSTRKFIIFISGRHRYPDLMHHIPDWFITFTANLALNLQRGKAFPGGGHKVNRPEPIHERKVGRLHDRTTSQGSAGSTCFTRKLANTFHPVMVGSFTLSTDNPLFQTIIPEKIPSRLFVGEHSSKSYKLHNHNFDSKLLGRDATYLLYGT